MFVFLPIIIKKILLCYIPYQADRVTIVAAVVVAAVARGIETARREVHVVRAAAIVVRSRPIAAVRTDIADRSPTAAACSRKEDTTQSLHL